ncbi:Ger(x)C family spore germination protein [Paenibacillus cymbidii]|uniref:Ger(x)C family spore germination protein n=1 Tax=Paenibacillus cymbidii TaxID=1639034 RepID=UPI0014368273|nr:Ger(x)C family spore germination protein [Paenibacillus cymbidii]
MTLWRLRFRRLALAAVLAAVAVPAGGCWSSKEIQNINYLSAIGVDYVNDRYVVYGQMIDFGHVAKQEGAALQGPPSIWIGKGEGKTLNGAVNEVYRTSQQQTYWAHVTAIVFSRRLLAHGTSEMLDLLNRYREIRYNIWAFATDRSIEELFSITPFFKLSPLSSILHEPEDEYKQRSYIRPMYMYQYMADVKEPAATAFLPSLSTSPAAWTENKKPHKLLRIDGVYYMRHFQLIAKLEEEQLDGLRWLDPHTARTPLTLAEDGEPVAVMVAEQPKARVRTFVQDGRFYADCAIKVKLGLSELVEAETKDRLKALAIQTIEAEVRRTYREGVAIGADVYQLGWRLHRSKPKLWHQLSDKDAFFLRDDSLRSLKVDVDLVYTGKYKLQLE